jgi:hypothetical protein
MVNLKIPIPKMKKKQKRIFFVGALMLLFFVSLGTGLIRFSGEADVDLFAFGNASYYKISLGSDSVVTADTVIDSTILGETLKIVFTWTGGGLPPTMTNFHCILRTSPFDNIDDKYASDSSQSSENTFVFIFDLAECYTGIHEYYVRLYATRGDIFYSGDSDVDLGFKFTISNIQETLAPILDSSPDIEEVIVDVYATLSWKFTYNWACTVTLEQDGALVDTRAYPKPLYPVSQQYPYVFTPTTEGTFTFKFVLQSDINIIHRLEDTVSFNVITVEDDILRDDLSEVLKDATAIVIDSQLAMFNFALYDEWQVNNFVPAGVYALSKTADLDIKLICNVALIGVVVNPYSDVKVVVFDAAGERTEYSMSLAFGIGLTVFGWPSIDSWFEVSINLDALPAGEYTFEIRAAYGGDTYRIVSFQISANTFPFGIIIIYAPWILIIGVIGIIMTKTLREIKGWWGFKGKYGNT